MLSIGYCFIYSGTKYYYVKNLQGDVMSIANADGVIVVNYTYDAWGNILSITGSLASTVGAVNPIRYRSYYYDTDTGFYYLQTRYYDPEIRRFINADDTAYLGTSKTFLSLNLYAYCENNPVKYGDSEGNFIGGVIGAVVGGIVGGVSAWVNGDDITDGILIGAGTGLISGLAADFAVATGGIGGIAIAAIGGAVSSGLNYSLTEHANGREFDLEMCANQVISGAITNCISFGAGGGTMQKVGGKIWDNVEKGVVNMMHEGIQKISNEFIKAMGISIFGTVSSTLSGMGFEK